MPQVDIGSWDDLGDGNSHPAFTGGDQGGGGGGACVLQLAVRLDDWMVGGASHPADQASPFSISASQYEEATVRLYT